MEPFGQRIVCSLSLFSLSFFSRIEQIIFSLYPKKKSWDTRLRNFIFIFVYLHVFSLDFPNHQRSAVNQKTKKQ